MNRLKWTFRFVAFGLFVYVLLRAILISFTPDEATSYYFAIGKYNHALHSNNHILNTQLMRVTHWLFGHSEWSLRLPNGLSFLVYCNGVWLILKRSNHLWVGLAGMAFLLLNPFALEFFSLARGYGLSLAFSMLALGLFIQSRTNAEYAEKSHFLVVIAAFLAVLSNFNAINFILLLFGWLIVDQARSGHGWIRRNLKSILGIGVTLTFAIGSLLILKGNDDLRFGAPSYYASFMRTARMFLYVDDQPIWFTELMGVAVGVLVSGILLWVLLNKRFTSNLAVALTLVIGIPFGWFVEHQFLGANLPEGRMLVNLLPILGLVFFLMLQEIARLDSVANKGYKAVLSIVALGFVINFGLSINLNTTHKWPDSSKTKEAIYFVGDLVEDWDEPASIERFNIYKNSTNYYISTRKLNIELTDDKDIKGEADILFVHLWEWERVEPLLRNKYELIWSEPNYPMRVYQSKASIEEHRNGE
ncbi:ArnT family glycosyltransferase [Phaeocystidibacter luteus]|nr:glycosyltransferase family 39 protein [Phaeocystidibacter luteus]